MNKILLLLSSILLSSNAGAVTVSYGMGEATSSNRIHACTIAENKAIKDALMSFSDRQFMATKQNVCHDTPEHTYCNYIREIDSSTSGTIRQVIERVRRTDGTTCFMEVKVEIEPAVQLPVEVNSKRYYLEGEQIDIEVEVGQPLYLHIFNLHEKGVEVLFPNKYNRETLMDDRFTFPSDGIQVIASTDGKQQSNETLLFLFTKRRQLVQAHFIETSVSGLRDLLESIPVNEKRLVQHNIVIRSK